MPVSVLFNEPKLLKFLNYNAAISMPIVSVLFNEPKLLKCLNAAADISFSVVSVLFNEPKLLKSLDADYWIECISPFQCSSTSRNC